MMAPSRQSMLILLGLVARCFPRTIMFDRCTNNGVAFELILPQRQRLMWQRGILT